MITVRGIEFNDARLARETLKAIDTLESMGYKPYNLTSVKLRKQQGTFGCCHTKKSGNRVVENKIYINRKMIEADDKSIQNLLIHELLHSLKECANCQHDGMWRECANHINKCTGLNIQQYSSYEEYGITKDKPNTYICKCADCGHVFKRMGYRAPKWYVHTERFSHTHADGTRHKIIAVK